jgi:hypothetical protein
MWTYVISNNIPGLGEAYLLIGHFSRRFNQWHQGCEASRGGFSPLHPAIRRANGVMKKIELVWLASEHEPNFAISRHACSFFEMKKDALVAEKYYKRANPDMRLWNMEFRNNHLYYIGGHL